MPIFKTFTGLSEAAHQICLSDALADVEAGSNRIQTASAAWARGDVRTAMTAERGYAHCLAQIPGGSAMVDRGSAEAAATITAQLARPGKAVAVMPLRQLLDHGGVIDRLRALGYVVEGPAL